MAVIYLDTNIIISAFKPNDPLYKDANKLFRKNHTYIISPVTLMELYSVLSRIKPYIKLKEAFKNVNLDTIISYIITSLKLQLITKTHIMKLQTPNQKGKIPLEYYISIKLAEKLRLKTLDLLHIAYAYILREEIDYFTTGDKDIIQEREKIKQQTGIEIKTPREIIKNV